MKKKEMLERIIALEARVVMLESRPIYYPTYQQAWPPLIGPGTYQFGTTTAGTDAVGITSTNDDLMS